MGIQDGPVAPDPNRIHRNYFPHMKKKTLGLVAGIALFATSCLGPNRAFNSVHEWNEGLSEQRWVNEGAFILLSPVYWVAYAGDVLIFNSIEWWGGTNPIGGGDDDGDGDDM